MKIFKAENSFDIRKAFEFWFWIGESGKFGVSWKIGKRRKIRRYRILQAKDEIVPHWDFGRGATGVRFWIRSGGKVLEIAPWENLPAPAK